MTRIDPKQQFSKRLARWTAVFWFVYMTWLSVIFVIEPAAALYSVYMGIIVTIVMLTNIVAYTRNSTMEKLALTFLDKTKLELKLANDKSSCETSEEETEEESEDEEGSNG